VAAKAARPQPRSGWHSHTVNPWDDLTLEQYWIMINAYDEAYLNDVMEVYIGHLRGERGEHSSLSDLDGEAKQNLIPHLAVEVADMIARGWIEIREPSTGVWDDADPMTGEQVRAALHDPASWIKDPDGLHRMVMLMRTDEWDRLAEEGQQSPNQAAEPTDG
jgi:hypothetical protein